MSLFFKIFFKRFLFFILIGLVFSFQAYRPYYLPNADECPEADGLLRFYIPLPLIPEFPEDKMPELFPKHKLYHGSLKQGLGKRRFLQYVELLRPFDSAKEILLVLAGGPGLNHAELLHGLDISKNEKILSKFNVMSMDHRGTGCTRPLFPDAWPNQTLLMRYAAADIEAIRKYFKSEKSFNIYAVSYGTFLTQTYALMYPEVEKKLFLLGSLSSYLDVREADKSFEGLVRKGLPHEEDKDNFDKLKNIDSKVFYEFLHWVVDPIYFYQDEKDNIAKKLEDTLLLVRAGKLQEASYQLKVQSFVMDPLMRSIICTELIPHLQGDEKTNSFYLFPSIHEACKEFKDFVEPFNYTPYLPKIFQSEKLNKIFLWTGAYDHVTPVAAANKMKEQMPEATFYVDEDSGHCISAKKKDFFEDVLFKFLSQ